MLGHPAEATLRLDWDSD